MAFSLSLQAKRWQAWMECRPVEQQSAQLQASYGVANGCGHSLGDHKRAVEASGKQAHQVRTPSDAARLTCGAREVGVHHSLVIGILIQINLENKVPRRFVILLGACDAARALSGRENTRALRVPCRNVYLKASSSQASLERSTHWQQHHPDATDAVHPVV